MVAHPGLDVPISALTCGPSYVVRSRSSVAVLARCPVSTGRKWLVAALCAQYVPKFVAQERRPVAADSLSEA
jgi:hypothetical protein